MKLIAPYFALNRADHPNILAFAASDPRNRLAVGIHSVPQCPQRVPACLCCTQSFGIGVHSEPKCPPGSYFRVLTDSAYDCRALGGPLNKVGAVSIEALLKGG